MQELARQLSAPGSPVGRAAAATAMTVYPSDPLAWSCLAAAERDADPTVAAAATAALDAIFTAHPDLVVPFSARDAGEGTAGYFATLDRLVARLPTRVALDALFVALDRGVLGDVLARGLGPVRSLCALVYGEDPLAENDLAGRLGQRRNRTETLVHQLLCDPTSKAAGIAVLVLGFWDDPRSIAALLQVVRDPAYSRSIRDDALESLGQLEAPEAVEVLCEALGDPTVDGFVKRNCVAALGYIGEADALPALEAIVRAGKDRDLVIAAQHAIEEIEENDA
jgi:HEAT repeat protein